MIDYHDVNGQGLVDIDDTEARPKRRGTYAMVDGCTIIL